MASTDVGTFGGPEVDGIGVGMAETVVLGADVECGEG